MIYAGVGVRQLPENAYQTLKSIGAALALDDWTLRSGAADGADSAFEEGCNIIEGKKEIYLPWEGFNGHSSTLYSPPPRAFEIAKEYHPIWNRLTKPQKSFMARNTQQVLGELIFEPCDLVICWTKDGCEDGTQTTKNTGGTGQALRVAAGYNIPIFNLKNKDCIIRLLDFLGDFQYNSISTNEE